MNIRLSASLVRVEGNMDRYGAVSVSFEEEQEHGEIKKCISFQRFPSEIEELDAIKSVCTIWGLQKHKIYGGIESFILDQWTILCRFGDVAAKELGGITSIQISYPTSQHSEIRDALRYIFKGCHCYRETIRRV